MDVTSVTLAEAKARLSELTERAAAGEEVVITKRGRPVARLSRVTQSKRSVDVERLRRLTATMARQAESGEDVIRRLRDESRY
ncbi:MAG: type II toxin-antitoxin system prevent-host-death family antitoxin [Gammaproteobacteria bacterium]|nr:MAG: type II toxin-antitoxin system prevent-host-death family antitoxin [Gammaproteobacteria bacterium]